MISCPDARIITTDNVTASGAFYDMPDGVSAVLTFIVVARQVSGPGRACFRQSALVSKDSGVVTVSGVGNLEKFTSAGATTWAATVAIIGGSLFIRVTGENGKTIDWSTYMEGYST